MMQLTALSLCQPIGWLGLWGMVQKSASNNAIEVWQDRGESSSAIYNNSKFKSSGFIKAPRASVAASLVTFFTLH